MSQLVNTLQGSLQGKENKTYAGKTFYSFEGIPYAKPPVGKLRFRDPQPPENWTGVLDATKPGKKCAQLDPYANKSFEGSEDCLYLNVYTPSSAKNNLPVLVFVHGGRFLVGHGDYYKPDNFLHNDIIVVTVNYRLHILGFLCLHIPEAPGNAALKDVAMALRWVKNNINYFGGDKNNVTICGESAGAGLISSFLTIKSTYNLYDKVISQSGISVSDLYFIQEDPIEKAKNIASLLGKELNDSQSLYNFLVNVPIDELLVAVNIAEVSRPAPIINAYFLPVLEKKFDGVQQFFEESPYVALKENRFNKVPVLLGVNSHEGALFLQRDDEGKIAYTMELNTFVPRFLFWGNNSPQAVKLGTKLKEFYFQNKEVGEGSRKEYLDFVSDAYFNRDIVMFAEMYSKYCGDLYFYNFCYAGNMNTRIMKSLGVKGATHGDMIQYQFYKESKAAKSTEKDQEISRFLSEAWCNFARNGKPSWSNQTVEWLPYKQDRRLCLNIDEELSVTHYPNWNRVKFWIDNMGERSKL